MPTIKDVAKKAGVSIITVSRFFNEPEKVSTSTKKKINTAIEAIGYFPNEIARSLVKKKTNVLGVIMADIKNTFFNELFCASENYARKYNYSILLCNTEEDPERELKYLKLLASQKVDGILLAPADKRSVSFLEKNKIKYVLVDRHFEDINSDYIITDHYKGSKDIVEYLIDCGHRNIAILKGSGQFFSGARRFDAFKEVMKKNKIRFDKSNIIDCGFKQEIAYNETKNFLSKSKRPSAIYSFNSVMTIGAIKAINDLGLTIPNDISIVGFDKLYNHNVLKPNITCVSQDVNLMGSEAIRILIEKINDSKTINTNRLVLKPKLVIGDSVKIIKR